MKKLSIPGGILSGALGSRPMNRLLYFSIKIALLIFICLLTVYAPLELSKLILNYGYGLNFSRSFELCAMWVFYLVAIIIIAIIIGGLPIRRKKG